MPEHPADDRSSDDDRAVDRVGDGIGARPGHDRSATWPPGLDQALDSLTAVGDRERRQLTTTAMDRIARAAAEERALRPPTLVEPVAGPRSESISPDGSAPAPIAVPTALELTDADGLRRHPRRRPVLALAAAVLVVALAGAALLSEPEQVVVTQEGAASGAAPDAAAGESEARPVLDLGESMVTTLVTAPATSTRPAEPATSTSTSAPPTSVEARSSASSTASPSSSSPTSSPPTTVGDGGPTGRPAADGWLRFEVGGAGAVALRLDDSTPEILGVMPAPGWEPTLVEPRAGGIDVAFVDELAQASLGVRSDPTRFLLEVDDGGTGRSQTEWITTYTIDDAGVVRTTYTSDGLRTLDVQLPTGWQHHITTNDADHLLVHIVNPDRFGRSDRRIDAGPVTIDLLITGS